MLIFQRTLICLSFAASVILTPMALADKTWGVQSESSPVEFLATGRPGFLKIKGIGARLRGHAHLVGDQLNGEFMVSLADLRTGIDLRDQHMRERYLEIEKFPEATLRLAPLTVGQGVTKLKTEFNGTLTLKGISNPIAGEVELDGLIGEQATGKASFEIKLKDYPVGVPSHLGVTVADVVKVDIEFVAVVGSDGRKT